MNFKRDLNLLQNLINSPKFLLDLIFEDVNLVGITCMQAIEYDTSAKQRGLNKIKEFEFEIQTLQYFIYKSNS
jgi:hypothetical protein